MSTFGTWLRDHFTVEDKETEAWDWPWELAATQAEIDSLEEHLASLRGYAEFCRLATRSNE